MNLSLSTLLLAIFLILTGLNLLEVTTISNTVLGVVALIAGIAFLVEGYHPVTLLRRRES
jgi:hypothetical protein